MNHSQIYPFVSLPSTSAGLSTHVDTTRVFTPLYLATSLGSQKFNPLHCCQNNIYLRHKSDHVTLLRKALPLVSVTKFTGTVHPSTPWVGHRLLVQPHLIYFLHAIFWNDVDILKYAAHSDRYWVVVEVWEVEENGEEDLERQWYEMITYYIYILNSNFLNEM